MIVVCDFRILHHGIICNFIVVLKCSVHSPYSATVTTSFCKNLHCDLVSLQKSSNKESSVKALPSSTSEPSQLSLSDSSMPPTPVTPVTPTAPALPATPISPPPVSVVSKSVPSAGSEPAKPSQRYAPLLSYTSLVNSTGSFSVINTFADLLALSFL